MRLADNTLFYGDNLQILRRYIPDEVIDLIYLDPPFNSSRNYNVLFQDESGSDSEAQITAFEDSWHWGPKAEEEYEAILLDGSESIATMIESLRSFIGTNQMMAYLVMMTARLMELHRVLKPTGSLYIHCDPTASHYLKIILDTIFGIRYYRNHINWKRSDTHNDATGKYPAVSDHILFYTKSEQYTFNPQFGLHAAQTLREWYLYLDLPDGTTRKMTPQEIETQIIPTGARRFNTGDMTSPNPRPNLMYEYKGYPFPAKGWRYARETMEKLDAEGRLLFPKKANGRIMLKRYLDEQDGAVVGDAWNDISQIRAKSAERLGYPTQKPLALLERLIAASSNKGDLVLDPFCGCGTTIAAAEKLGRRWVGIDITSLSIALQKYRLQQMFPSVQFDIIGQPMDMDSARQLAKDDPFQFEWWALSLIQARPTGAKAGEWQGRRGPDGGIDGIIPFTDGKPKTLRAIIQVKSGKVGSRFVRELRGLLDDERVIGVLITLVAPTRSMIEEAASAGFYESPSWGRKYPRMQILTIADIFGGKQVAMPPAYRTFKQAQRVEQDTSDHQGRFDI